MIEDDNDQTIKIKMEKDQLQPDSAASTAQLIMRSSDKDKHGIDAAYRIKMPPVQYLMSIRP